MKRQKNKMMKNKLYYIITHFIILLLINISASKDNTNIKQLINTAEQLEKINKNNQALEIYLKLFDIDKTNKHLFKKIKKILINKKDYEELILIYNQYLNSLNNSQDKFSIEMDLLEIKIWNNSNNWEIYLDDIFNRYILNNKDNYGIKKNKTKYIIQKLIKNELHNKSYEIVKNIRNYFKNELIENSLIGNNLSYKDTIFLSKDMISVFSKEKQYQKAIEESILYLKNNPKNHFYNIIKDEMFNFCDQIIKSAITNNFNFPITNKQFNANTFLNYQIPKKINQNNINYIINIYNNLIKNNIVKNEAKLRLANIQYKFFDDLDNAYKLYSELDNKQINKIINHKAAIKKIDILIKKGYLDSAFVLIEDKRKEIEINNSLKDKKNILNKLSYKNIEILFYKGNYLEMNQNLDLLINNNELDDNYLNDLLEIKNIALFFNKDQEIFKKYSSIQHKIKMNKSFEANFELIEIINSENILISELAQFQYALIEIKKGNIKTAKEMILSMNQKTIFSEISLIINAEIEDYIYKNNKESIKLYEEFLNKYPNSIYKENIIQRLNVINKDLNQKIDL